jgi:hypothetical protein
MKDGWISRQLAQSRFYLGSEAHDAELSTVLSTFSGKSHGTANIADAEIVGCLCSVQVFFRTGGHVVNGSADNEPPAADLATVQLLVKRLLITLARA